MENLINGSTLTQNIYIKVIVFNKQNGCVILCRYAKIRCDVECNLFNRIFNLHLNKLKT